MTRVRNIALVRSNDSPRVERGLRDRCIVSSSLAFCVARVAVFYCVLIGSNAVLTAAPELVSLDKKPVAAEFVSAAAGALSFRMDEAAPGATPSVERIAVGAVVRWGHPARPRPQTLVMLRDGSRLVAAPEWSGGAAVVIDGDSVVVRPEAWNELSLERSQVAGVVLAHREDWQMRQALEDEVLTRRGEQDVVLLANDDQLSGRITSLGGGALSVNVAGQETQLPLARVAAVILAARDPSPAAPHKARLIVGMHDGSLLRATAITGEGNKCSVELAGGPQLTGGHVEDIVALQGLGGMRFDYLSDLEPIDYRHIPYLSLDWPYRRDRNVVGQPLAASEKRYLKGLGTHSASRLTYRLDGKYQRFDAAAAIDDSAEGRGSVTFGVYLLRDGKWKQAAISDVVRGGGPPEPVSVDVRGAEMITLVIDFADRGDEMDRANWLDARMVK